MPNKKKEIKKRSIELTQIVPIEERVETIERLIVFSFLAVATFYAIGWNQTYFLGKNLIIFHLTVFFISFPMALYYFAKTTVIFSWSLGESSGRLGKRLGESIGSYILKHESKLKTPFYLILALLGILIAHYILGKDLSDIIYSVLVIIIVAAVKKSFDYRPKTKKKKKTPTQKLLN